MENDNAVVKSTVKRKSSVGKVIKYFIILGIVVGIGYFGYTTFFGSTLSGKYYVENDESHYYEFNGRDATLKGSTVPVIYKYRIKGDRLIIMAGGIVAGMEFTLSEDRNEFIADMGGVNLKYIKKNE